DEGRFVRGEEEHGLRDILRGTRASERAHRLPRGGRRVNVVSAARHRGVDESRTHAVHADPVRRALDGSHLCELEDAGLRGRVGPVTLLRSNGRPRGNVDDRTSTLLPEDAEGGAREEKRAGQVDGEHVLPLLLRGLLEWRDAKNPAQFATTSSRPKARRAV